MSAPAGCSPQGPGGVSSFLQGLFSSSSKVFYRVCQTHESEFGSFVFRSGCRTSPRACRALACEPRSLGLGKVARRAPEPPHGARGRSGVPLAFCATLAHPFRSEGGVVCRALECEPGSLGLGKVAGKPPSLCTEREGDQEFPWLFVRPSCILFVRDEGWNMSGYPRWARAVTLPMSCYRVSPSGGPFPIR